MINGGDGERGRFEFIVICWYFFCVEIFIVDYNLCRFIINFKLNFLV